MYVVKEENLAEFVESLRQYFPTSLQIFCQARNILRKRCYWPGTEVVVDNYPNYSVCMSRPVPGSEEYIPRPRNWVQCVTLFAKTPEALKTILNEENVIDWYRDITFLSIPSEYVPVILERADLFGHTKGAEDTCRHNVFLFEPQNLERFIPPALPDDCRMGQLDVSHMEQVLTQWNNAGRGGNPEAFQPFFRYFITHDFPTSAMFNDKNDLVAYSVYSPNGSVSLGFVREDYRGRGVFQIVNADLTKKIFSELQQEITWAHVSDSNIASAKSLLKMGARKDPVWKTQALEYRPYT